MSQFVIAESLLSEKITDLEQEAGTGTGYLLQLCEKELKVLKRLRIEGIDLNAGLEDLEERLKGSSIYFMSKEEYDTMYRKAVLFDALKNIMEDGSNGK